MSSMITAPETGRQDRSTHRDCPSIRCARRHARRLRKPGTPLTLAERWLEKIPWPPDHVDTQHRGQYTRIFGFAIPNRNALTTIKACWPILEIGAGTGYWSLELSQEELDYLIKILNTVRGRLGELESN